ncbi:MAG: hypothetical protein OEZ54_11450 [Gemmatimonadota bacterium]|nr:hypothetical protein [Gemmatimonadota bacterium]
MEGSGRKFTEEEFALILHRAAQLQEDDGGIPVSDGLTLETIQEIAKEVGLDPGAVSRAASLISQKPAGRWARIFGGTDKFQLEDSWTGSLDKEELGELLGTIRRITGHQGAVDEVLGALEWKTVGEVSQIAVSVSSRDGKTTVRIIGDRSAAGALTWVMPIGGWLVVGGATGGILAPDSFLTGAVIFGTALAGGLTTARILWKNSTMSFKEKLNRLMHSIHEKANELSKTDP